MDRTYKVIVTYTVTLDDARESPSLIALYEDPKEELWNDLLDDAAETCDNRQVTVERVS